MGLWLTLLIGFVNFQVRDYKILIILSKSEVLKDSYLLLSESTKCGPISKK